MARRKKKCSRRRQIKNKQLLALGGASAWPRPRVTMRTSTRRPKSLTFFLNGIFTCNRLKRWRAKNRNTLTRILFRTFRLLTAARVKSGRRCCAVYANLCKFSRKLNVDFCRLVFVYWQSSECLFPISERFLGMSIVISLKSLGGSSCTQREVAAF
jgi:hypothetical protein